MINFPKISFDFLGGSWRYDPTIDEKRDFRLDFLRGIAIVFMVVNHLESRSYFNNVTQGHIYASAAEGFVFLSGFVLGMVTLKRIGKVWLTEAMNMPYETVRKYTQLARKAAVI
ncbi:MAG: OpgC domain-containing protein [Pseudanabaena sp.]|jgi:uncharacterized membrane protein